MLLVNVVRAGVVLENASHMRIGQAWDDPSLDAALPGVRAGRLDQGLELIRAARGDNELRALRVQELALAARSHTDALARLPENDPDALLWLGAARVKHAWDIRGASLARYVDDDRFTRFHEALEAAEPPLRRAAEALPEDPVPWAQLQWHAVGSQAGRPALDRIWRELHTRDPALYAGHHGRAQALCAKWYGSDDELLAFAHDTVEASRPGDPVTAILPLAHFEIAWQEADYSGHDNEETLRARFRRPDVSGELIEAADKWRVGSLPHPFAPEAMHLFGAAFSYSGHHSRAQTLLTGAGRRVPEILPWAAASITPGRRYARARRELGIT
ncbi:hypothetical protein ACWGH8_33475 [Nonomuraea muscovyensis]